MHLNEYLKHSAPNPLPTPAVTEKARAKQKVKDSWLEKFKWCDYQVEKIFAVVVSFFPSLFLEKPEKNELEKKRKKSTESLQKWRQKNAWV